MIGIVKDRLAEKDCVDKGWLLDGFPRTGYNPLLPKVNRDSTFALRRPTLDFCLGEQRSVKKQEEPVESH